MLTKRQIQLKMNSLDKQKWQSKRACIRRKRPKHKYTESILNKHGNPFSFTLRPLLSLWFQVSHIERTWEHMIEIMSLTEWTSEHMFCWKDLCMPITVKVFLTLVLLCKQHAQNKTVPFGDLLTLLNPESQLWVL